jgi:ethanolamine utilization protein EutQ
MSKRQLIVAADVRNAARLGEKKIVLLDKTSMVTAEARGVAKELGVALESARPNADTPSSPASAAAESGTVSTDAVRKVIEAQTKGPASEDMLREVMRRIDAEREAPEAPKISKITSVCSSPGTSDKGVNLSQLDLSSIVPTKAAPGAVGFMGWSKNVFPFDRSSEEVNLVLEGELQFHVGKEIICANPGDVMWIPKGVKGKIGTPTSVRYFYISYPV